jgi:hypothetical protein
MFSNPSLVTRIAIGKGLGFLIGLIGMFSIPYFAPETGWMFRWGVLLWYATLGAVVGMFGVFTWHPVLKLPLPWWFRASLVGGWMNFVLVLFAFDHFAAMMTTIFGADGIFQSPFWFTLEGALVGLIIGYFATKFGGEGAETVIADQPV